MKAKITIDTDNFCVTVRSHGDSDVDRESGLDLACRELAARMAAGESLPHYTLDVKIGDSYEYRENVSAMSSGARS